MVAHLIRKWFSKSFFIHFYLEWKRCLYRIQDYSSRCHYILSKRIWQTSLYTKSCSSKSQCKVHVQRKAFISHGKSQVWIFFHTSLVDIFYLVKDCFVVIVVNVLENLPSLGALFPKFTICLIFKKRFSQGWQYQSKGLLLHDNKKIDEKVKKKFQKTAFSNINNLSNLLVVLKNR